MFGGKSQKFYVDIVTEVCYVTHVWQNTGSLNFSNFGIICQAKKSAEIRKNDVIFCVFNGECLTYENVVIFCTVKWINVKTFRRNFLLPSSGRLTYFG